MNTRILLGSMVVLALVVGIGLRVKADVGPTITPIIQDGSNATITSTPIGTNVHARATVATTTASTTPTGTVDFNVYPNMTCAGSPTIQAGVALATGTAQSATTTVPAGGLSYKVHYNGDNQNATSDSACVALTATSANSALATNLSTTSAAVGTFVHDSANLTSVTSNASGTVAYSVYTNNSCTAGAQSAGTKSVNNANVPDSDSIQFNTPGTYYWQAHYSGDSQNVAATSTCTSEALTIDQPVVVTTTGHIIITKITNPATSTVFHFTTSGTGYAAFDLSNGGTPNNQTVATGTYSVTEQQVNGWNLTSATCSRNNGGLNAYTPGTSFTLNAGDTIACTFTNTLQATSTQGHDNDNDNDGDNDNDANDNGGHGIGQFIHDFIKSRFPNGHDNGKHKGQIKHDDTSSIQSQVRAAIEANILAKIKARLGQ